LNSKGLRNLAQHLDIADCCRDHNIDFVAILEMGRRDLSPNLLNHLSGGIDFRWFSHARRGQSRGILLAVLSDTVDILTYSMVSFT
jgi:hypothetical protein